ncbi:hypothetical protein NJ76_27940 [Rhodococcus sp. IITR03]|nr:hypothetical protein NJ76_27940 [Rhodococcus sp. IITR03]
MRGWEHHREPTPSRDSVDRLDDEPGCRRRRRHSPITDPPAGPVWAQFLASEDDLSPSSITRLTAQWQPPMQSR